ncbi:MAG: tail fiber domain-containing protein [Alphaproteobacteria bacterium]|nr:tail fiber domain-containing protein [Alphaproteobacteria bacterium]
MSKSLGFSGSKAAINPVTWSMYNYLNSIDTSAVDNTNNLLAQTGYNLAQTLSMRPDYVYSVDGSDEARQRAENAVYNSYVDKLTPAFANQTSDLETRLQNQGLSVGSEAYQRALTDLQTTQNAALNQAAYQSVLAGQNAFSDSLSNSISAADFSNNARMLPVSEILSLISTSPSGYQIEQAKYGLLNGAVNDMNQLQRQYDSDQASRLMNTISTTGKIAAAFMASDKRFKENIKKVGQLDNGLNVYIFNYKNDKTPRLGLIAQEVKKLKPEAVFEDKSGFLYIRYDLAVK